MRGAVADERVHLANADRLRRRCEYEAAEAELAAAAEQADGAGRAAVELAWGRLEFDRDDFAAALARLTEAAALDPGSEDAIGWQVAALEGLCRFDEARRTAEDGLARFPHSATIGVALARLLNVLKHPDAALARLDHVLDRCPDDENALEWKIEILAGLGRYAEAERVAEIALARHPESPGISESVGDIYRKQHRFDAALDRYEKVLGAHPDDRVMLCERVRVLRRAGRYDDARSAADEAARLLPRSANVLVHRSYLAEDEGRLTDALDDADAALRLQGNCPDALEQRIDILRKLRRYEEAEEAVERAIGAHPRSANLLAALAWHYLLLRRYEKALAMAERALALHPRHAGALDGRATALRSLRRFPDAEAAIADAVALVPFAPRLRDEWGLLLDEQERYAEALEQFEKALEADPLDDFALSWRVTELRRLRRYEEAEEASRAALDSVPSAGNFLERGRLYRDQERYPEALADFRRALDLDPGEVWAHVSIVDCLRRSARFDEAEEAAEQAVARFPNDPAVRRECGYLHVSRDMDERALQEFRKAVELDPVDPYYQVDVGYALLWLNRYREAESFLRDALRKKPGNAQLIQALAAVLTAQDRHDAAFDELTGAEQGDVGIITDLRISSLRQARRFEEAEALALDAVERRPDIVRHHLELAQVHSDRGRHAEAESVLRDALHRFPRDPDILQALLNLHRWLGRYEDALSESQCLLESSPRSVTVLLQHADLLDDLDRQDEAVRRIQDAMPLHPGKARLRQHLAWSLYDRGKYGDALAEFEQASATEPTRAACYGRAAALCRLDRHDEAMSLLRAEAAFRPNYAQTWVELADVYEDLGRYGEALTAAEQAIGVDPFHVEAHEKRIRVLRLQQRPNEAEAAANEALTRMPGNAALVIARGRVFDDRNEYAEALEDFDRALELLPLFNVAVIARSSTLRSLRRFSEAERTVSAAAERYPRNASLRMELGWIHRDQGRPAEARRVFESLRDEARSPGRRAEACAGLGWAAFTSDDHAAAERHFRAACEAGAGPGDWQVGLAWTLAGRPDRARWDEAERLCLDLLQRRPGHLMAHTCLGVLYYRREEYAAAEHHLKRTIELDPYDGGYVDLASLYVHLGRFEEAEEMLDKALRRDAYDAQAHIEYGNLCLQCESDEAEADARARQAVRHFRQALTLSPASGPAAIGLAIGLARSPGDLLAAERVLRDAVERAGNGPSRPKLLLALARLLVERGDATQRPELYREAVTTAQEAIERASGEAEAYFVAGVATYKTAAAGAEVRTRPFYRRRAVRYLKECVRRDAGHVEGRRLLLLAEESARTARGGAAGSAILMTIATSLLAALWIGFFLSNRISSTVLATLTPVLVGLVALGFVLPLLVRLKLPGGVEADLSASLQQVSSGPTGDVSIGPGRFGGQGADTMSMAPFVSGPSGQLPRLESER
ncbi:tetratricopeptide repeat protein [Actinomadura nitritigenes]|uniref:tetratricopeptide repeat protein n=1 Tax=Actinomadura nitritigenes TaxID=134602 RepID=UPI003681DD0A